MLKAITLVLSFIVMTGGIGLMYLFQKKDKPDHFAIAVVPFCVGFFFFLFQICRLVAPK